MFNHNSLPNQKRGDNVIDPLFHVPTFDVQALVYHERSTFFVERCSLQDPIDFQFVLFPLVGGEEEGESVVVGLEIEWRWGLENCELGDLFVCAACFVFSSCSTPVAK